jgi:hypothetical protein
MEPVVALRARRLAAIQKNLHDRKSPGGDFTYQSRPILSQKKKKMSGV